MVRTAPLFEVPARRWALVALTTAMLAVAPSVVAAPGDLTSYAVPPGAVTGVAVAPDGGIWFTLRTGDAVGRLDPSDGSIQQIAVDAGSEPTAITVADDGTAWFTLQEGNAIGRTIPGGDTAVYALPNDGSNPAGIATGPDGSIWFTERFGGRIGRIGPDGTITEWATTVGGPQGLAVADDGVVWFAGQSGSALGAFDPATETFTSVELPSASSPTGVAIGADGDVWVTLRRAHAVARYDVETATLSTTALASGGSPSGVAAGPDGGVWVSETAAGLLTRIDPETGHVGPVDLGPTAPQQVAADPGGFVWVAEAMADRLSSLEVEVVTPPTDTTPPTIDLRSPTTGSWTAPGVPLVADYACADEGGSGLASCAGPVPSGTAVDATPGAHPFEVVASDGAGNMTAASASYLAFTSASGTALGGNARAGAGLTLSLGMDLAARSDLPIDGTTLAVDCATGDPLGQPAVAELRDRVANRGSLELRWLTSREWTGCRTLTLAFAADGWHGASATFGPVSFGAGGAAAKR